MTEKEPAGDEHMGPWVYCSQHLAPHATGWCAVSPREKIPLDVASLQEAARECENRGYVLYGQASPIEWVRDRILAALPDVKAEFKEPDFPRYENTWWWMTLKRRGRIVSVGWTRVHGFNAHVGRKGVVSSFKRADEAVAGIIDMLKPPKKKPDNFFTLVESHKGTGFREGEVHAIVEILGCQYRVSRLRGKRVRIAYSAKWGHKWAGVVREKDTGREVWSAEVNKSTGIAFMLECAGLVPLRPNERKKVEREHQQAAQRLEASQKKGLEGQFARRDFDAADNRLNVDNLLRLKFAVSTCILESFTQDSSPDPG